MWFSPVNEGTYVNVVCLGILLCRRNCRGKGNLGNGGMGGIIRDAKGKWAGGFYCRLDKSTSLMVEIENLRRGLLFAAEKGIEGMEVEIDSKLVCRLSKDDLSDHQMRNNLEDYKSLLTICKRRIKYTMRE